MLTVAVFFFNALRKVDLSSLFLTDDPLAPRKVSATKFWTSVAYFVATVAFLSANFIAPVGATLEFIWIIYLSTVAGHAAFSKWITSRVPGGTGNAEVNVAKPIDTKVSVEVSN